MNLQENIRRILREVRVPRSERVELYKDDNIIVVAPLTHRALQKYAHQCQWCINSDLDEWEEYHKGKHAVIIQRNPKKPKIGITGFPTASEILMLQRWGEGYTFNDIQDILGYEFDDEQEADKYLSSLTKDINNFATNIVYYSPKNGIYDMEDNQMIGYNVTDIPNVTPEVRKIMYDYLQENEEMSIQESIRKILREETHLSTFIRRRVPIDELEQEFNEAIIYATDLYKRKYGHLEGSEGLREFRRLTLAVLMDGIHWMLHSTTNEDRNWYQEALDDLESYYKDRIFDEWEAITN